MRNIKSLRIKCSIREVGWRKANGLKVPEELTYKLEEAPKGHLPHLLVALANGAYWWWGYVGGWKIYNSALASRLEKCSIDSVVDQGKRKKIYT